MRKLTVLVILFYTAVLVLFGLGLIIFALKILVPLDITNSLAYIQAGIDSRIIAGLSGALLILISFSLAQFMLGRFREERTIAFSTSSGEVTIALSAVEDLIKRLSGIIPEIRELRPYVIAKKNGSIIVDLRVILKSEANIPELTSRLQEITKAKIQEALGLEEQIIIKIHVTKIVFSEEKERKRRELDKEEPRIPFSGYGRV